MTAIVFPLNVVNGVVQTCEQGSPEDISGCMAVVCCWPVGTKRGNPGFGLPPLNFDDTVDVEALQAAVVANEPRAAGVSAAVVAEAAGVAEVDLGYGS